MRILVFGCLAPIAVFGSFDLSVTPSQPSPASVGEIVAFTANAPGDGVWYRFRARRAGEEFRTILDYGPDRTLEWTASESEGAYEIEVSARNLQTGDTAVAALPYLISTRVTANTPVVSGTLHPLVFLYSAPGCAAGGAMRVEFRSPEGTVQSTPAKPCTPGRSMNFYLAGMRAQTEYAARQVVMSENKSQLGEEIRFKTLEAPEGLLEMTVLQAPPAASAGILFSSPLAAPTLASDLQGNLVWFYPRELTFSTRAGQGGRFFGIIQAPGLDQSGQRVREFDLVGMTLRETNAARVNEQLIELGRRPVSGFHHEAFGLPDGRMLVLASSEQMMADVQGEGSVNVLSDTILVLDVNLQVVWVWDGFDHMDVRRVATLNETCGRGACPPLYLTQDANDWLHGNSVQLTPDGNLIFSMRHQDWLIKIDFNNGTGSGNVIWRLGKDGDFTYAGDDEFPWFSHQHDARFLDDSTIIVFDNGNYHRTVNPEANSRGQVIAIDEAGRAASLILNIDLGGYSFALGSAQKLSSGNYHFELGWLPDGSSLSVEYDGAGNLVYALRAALPRYRTFRMPTMYEP
ncbi:MAG: aryl-sulfate sulfotransferase [Bryobacteraceae bacterium]|nr:aryl-sulfate sulfotransferase [Bryobacteraceae bacterium]